MSNFTTIKPRAKREPKVECICQQCEKSFSRASSKVKRGAGKYCSRACRDLSRTTRMNCICQQCGKSFELKPSAVKRGWGKSCSRACANLLLIKQVDCVCGQCGNSFKAHPSAIKRGGGKYCSPQCFGLAHTGETSYSWRGGHRYYRGKNWGTQRKLAYARDSGICQHCGKKSQKGKPKNAVHHIKRFDEFNGDYLAANQLTNLITLCQPCHMKAEHGIISVQPFLF